MQKFSRRAVLAGTVAASLPARAQGQPLRIVLGYPPGASGDTVTRLIAEKMRVTLGRAVVVENKPGAAGIVANLAVKSAAPDGNTLLMTPLANMVAFPHSYAKLDYDPFKDYAPVAHVAAFQIAFGIGPNVPAKTLAEYVALARSGGTYANFASAAVGSLPHFFGLLFARTAGLQLTHVPYKGTANVLQALISGEVPAAVLPIADLGTLAQSGKGSHPGDGGRQALAAISRCADLQGKRLRHRGLGLVRAVCAGRHAEGDRRQACRRRDRCGPPARPQAADRAAGPRSDRSRACGAGGDPESRRCQMGAGHRGLRLQGRLDPDTDVSPQP